MLKKRRSLVESAKKVLTAQVSNIMVVKIMMKKRRSLVESAKKVLR